MRDLSENKWFSKRDCNFSRAAALRDSEFHPFDGIQQPRRESDNISSLDDQGTIPTISDLILFFFDVLGIN